MSYRNLALIPAKGASKRLPRKNILPFANTSLLELAINCAKESDLCQDIMVSSEDQEILTKAMSLGAGAIQRPEKLSVDPAGVVEVALHALDVMEHVHSKTYDHLFILTPTCPLREPKDVIAAYDLYEKNRADCLMSVSEYAHSPYSAWTVDKKGHSSPLFPELCVTKSQELPKTYRCNGAIHIVNVSKFKEVKSYTSDPLTSYIMPRERSYDIDTKHDFWEAEAYYKETMGLL